MDFNVPSTAQGHVRTREGERKRERGERERKREVGGGERG